MIALIVYLIAYLVTAVGIGKLVWVYKDKLPHFYSNNSKKEALTLGYLWPLILIVAIFDVVHTFIMKGINKWY